MEGEGMVLKCLFLAALLVIMANNNCGVDGAGECGTLDPEVLAYKLAPCAAASQDKNVAVPSKCCALASKVRTNCLCAIILSKEAKSLGIKPDVAATIPKRCNIPRRSKGYKCGAYVVPA